MSLENVTDSNTKPDQVLLNQWSLPTTMCVRGRYVISWGGTAYLLRIEVPVKTFSSEEEVREYITSKQLKNI